MVWYYLDLIHGNIECARVVEVLLHLTDGSIPAPHFDLVLARAERCTFRDKSGVLVTRLQQQPSHCHIHLDCARAVEPNFVPLALHVPSDFLPKLTIIHHEYLQLLFGLSLLYTPSWFSNLICCCCSVVIAIKLSFSYFTRTIRGTDTGVVGDYDHNFNTKSIIKITYTLHSCV